MANRTRVNARRIKIHRSYSVDEAARALGVCKQTVRRWLKDGLPRLDSRRPTMILGSDLKAFLKRRRQAGRHTLLPGEMYCMKCRCPRLPELGFAELAPWNDKIGSVSGFCPECGSVMNRRVGYRKFSASVGNLEVSIPEGLKRLVQCLDPSLNDYLNRDF